MDEVVLLWVIAEEGADVASDLVKSDGPLFPVGDIALDVNSEVGTEEVGIAKF